MNKLYLCDPAKNKRCTKEKCFIHGGDCKHTCRAEFAIFGESEEINMSGISDNIKISPEYAKLFNGPEPRFSPEQALSEMAKLLGKYNKLLKQNRVPWIMRRQLLCSMQHDFLR